jgi:CRP-like cAMP-binding protein
VKTARDIRARYELALSILAMAEVAALAPEDKEQWAERRTPASLVAEAIPMLRECGAEADLGRAFELQDRIRMGTRGESAFARALAASGAPERLLEAGTLIVAEGEAGDEMFLIRSGVVRVFRGHGVDEFTLGLLGSGDFFGEMSLIGDAVRSASVRAVTDVDLIALDRAKFDQIVSDPVAREIIGRMSDRVRELGERAEQLSKLERPLPELVTDPIPGPAPRG